MRTLIASSLSLAAGCWVGPAGPPPQEPPQPAPAQTSANTAAPGAQLHHSEWQGTYVCAQGETALHLSIDQRCVGGGCEVNAVFEFGPSPTNPTVPHGSYRMTGDVNGDDAGVPVLVLRPTTWIDQPPSYVMVGLHARSDANQQTLRGRMDNPTCGELALQRVQ